MEKLIEESDYNSFLKKSVYHYKYIFDDDIYYDDIESIINALPKDIKYKNFSIANYDAAPDGFIYVFDTLDEFKSYYKYHPDMINVDNFSFSAIFEKNNVGICFGISDNKAFVTAGENQYDFSEFFTNIEKSIVDNKKKQL